MGCAYAPSCLDTGFGSAHHKNVWSRRDADSIPQASIGKELISRLLRGPRLALAEGTHSLRLHRSRTQQENSMAESPDPDDHPPVGGHPYGSFAASESIRPEGASNCHDVVR